MLGLFLLFAFCFSQKPKRPVSVVIDTDIGQDFDDSWAVALSLVSPEAVDIKMILTAAHNTHGRAQITCKYLEAVGRTDIPVGVGKYQDDYVGPLYGWAQDYDIKKYPGELHEDGVSALNDILMASKEPVYILAIAPMVNFKELIDRFPDAVDKVAGIIAMSGSIYKGYNRQPPPNKEYNVVEDIPASQAAYTANWNITSTPLDTCTGTHIRGDKYQNLLKYNTTEYPVLNVLLANFCYWAKGDCYHQSSTLYDAVAAYMMCMFPDFESHGLKTTPKKIVVENDGMTRVDEDHGKWVTEALEWTSDGEGTWEDWVVNTLIKKSKV